MKKILGVLVFVLVLSVAGSALAFGGMGRGRGMGGPGMTGQGGGWGSNGMGMMGAGGRAGWIKSGVTIEIPQDIRDKPGEVQKIAIDLRSEMTRNPMDRAKAEALQKKLFEFRNEISGWFMKQQLDTIEKLQK